MYLNTVENLALGVLGRLEREPVARGVSQSCLGLPRVVAEVLK